MVWFRRDLRLDDNPAWAAATASHPEVLALFVLDPALLGAAGPFRRTQLLAELAALDDELASLGGRLHVRSGDPVAVVPEVLAAAGPGSVVHWNADVSPYATARDDAVAAVVGSSARTWPGTLVHAPGRVLTAKGTTSKVFTPFHRTWLRTPWAPWPEPGPSQPAADVGDGLAPLGARASAGGGDAPQPPGAAAALARLDRFVDRIDRYPDDRDRLDLDATSSLSVDLRFGTISPRAVVRAVEGAPGAEAFVRQVAWREWFAHLLAARPELVRHPMQARYEHLPWRDAPEDLAAWREGRTGIPVVDAGMRQLAATGRLHGRARMVCASFLVKNLLVDWRRGERHLRHLLVDGDVAQNVGNWQWVAGTGPDAAPYDRVFNPVLQARRHDPEGNWVRTWVPELAELAGPSVHAPWELGPLELVAAGVVLGETYPAPIVDLGASRARAIEAYRSVGR